MEKGVAQNLIPLGGLSYGESQSLPAQNLLSHGDKIEIKPQRATIKKSSTPSAITKVTWVISATWSASCQKFGQMKCFQRIPLTPERKNIFLAQTVIEVWQQNWDPKSLNRKTRIPVSVPTAKKGREIVISRDDIPEGCIFLSSFPLCWTCPSWQGLKKM